MTSPFDRLRTFADYQRANEEFLMKRQLAQAEIAKAQQLDADKLGEQAFMKAAQGLPLTPQEQAAAQLMDAKSGGVSFNPVTGEMLQKPRISDKIGIPGLNQQSQAGGFDMAGLENPDLSQIEEALGSIPGSDGVLPGAPGAGAGSIPQKPQANPFDALYEESLRAAAGNPKLLQQLKADHLKDKMTFTEGQSNAATYADRMRASEAILNNPKIANAGMEVKQISKRAIPLIGNFLVSDEFQQSEQAQRDFVNAVLRRESGAVISPSEFMNAKRQYFPQPGDSETVLAQKKANRENALAGVSRSAGPAYQPTEILDPYTAQQPENLYQKSEKEFNAKKPKARLKYNPATGEFE